MYMLAKYMTTLLTHNLMYATNIHLLKVNLYVLIHYRLLNI